MDINELESFKLSDAVKFHNKLNPKLWTGTRLDPEVREQLIEIADDFISTLGIHDLAVKDITVSGSNAAYSYTPHSDLDLHIVVDIKKLANDEIYRELFNAKKTLYNDMNDITVHGVPVELYVQDSNEPVVSLGEYSVLHDKWIHVPKKSRANFDEVATKAKFENLAELVDLALKTADIDRVAKVIDTIKRYRKAGLAKGGEFSPENLAFKAIRTQGGIDALYDLRNKLHGQNLSIEEAVESKDDAINLINKLKNTSGRPPEEAEAFNAKVDELMQKYDISPEEVGMSNPVDPLQAKIAAAAYERQQAAAMLKNEWDKFIRGIFTEDNPPPENARKTQIAGTLPTYKKAAELLKRTGAKGRGLDFGAGLGLGTSELGPDADSYEPYPGEGFQPKFVDVTKIPDNSYHRIVSLNVLNVVPNAGDERIRDSIVRNIGRVLAPGGVAIITTRGRDVLTIKGTPGEEPMSMISQIGTYQKGFTSTELKEYVQSILGSNFDVFKIKLGPAGVMIKKKDTESLTEEDEYPVYTTKQQVIDHFVRAARRLGKSIVQAARQGAMAWERGWRGPKPKEPKNSGSNNNQNVRLPYVDETTGVSPIQKPEFRVIVQQDRKEHPTKFELLVEMYVDNVFVGRFKFLRHEVNRHNPKEVNKPILKMSISNVVILSDSLKGTGLGKLLLLKTIDAVQQHGYIFSQDNFQVSPAQLRVYKSLARDGYIQQIEDPNTDYLIPTHPTANIRKCWKITPAGQHWLNSTSTTNKTQIGVTEASIILSTDPDNFGATVDDTNLKKLPVVMLPLKKLVHFEPLSKMETPEAKKWVKRLMSKIEKGRKIKPILVREWENGYQVIDGHHRFQAYKLLNKPEIPAQIVPDDEIEIVSEASGYIPSAKEKNDPRFKTALTVDVGPDAIRKNAKAFGFKTSRAGIPPQARADGKIAENYYNIIKKGK
jgi:hypothetical protein